MSEDLSQAVPATTATEAVPPVRAIDSDDPALLRNKIELAKGDRDKAVAEKQSYKKQLEDMARENADLRAQKQKIGQDHLVKNQEFETLWKDASKTVTSLQDENAQLKQMLLDKDVENQQQQIKTTAMDAFHKGGVHTPGDLFNLEKDHLRLKDGSVVALVGGVEVPLQQHVESLRSPGSGRDYFFAGSGARGMSAGGSSTTTSGGQSWSSMSAFERMSIEAMDERNGTNNAARLKAAG